MKHLRFAVLIFLFTVLVLPPFQGCGEEDPLFQLNPIFKGTNTGNPGMSSDYASSEYPSRTPFLEPVIRASCNLLKRCLGDSVVDSFAQLTGEECLETLYKSNDFGYALGLGASIRFSSFQVDSLTVNDCVEGINHLTCDSLVLTGGASGYLEAAMEIIHLLQANESLCRFGGGDE